MEEKRKVCLWWDDEIEHCNIIRSLLSGHVASNAKWAVLEVYL